VPMLTTVPLRTVVAVGVGVLRSNVGVGIIVGVGVCTVLQFTP